MSYIIRVIPTYAHKVESTLMLNFIKPSKVKNYRMSFGFAQSVAG